METATYKQQFSSLKTARVAGKKAPHKAILLLAIIDLVEIGDIDSPRVELTDRLEEAFDRNWKRYIGTSLIFQPKVSTPFWHMLTEPFYRLYISSGQQINGGTGRYSVKWLRENTYALIDEQLLKLMQDENSRAELRVLLISKYLQELHIGVGGNILTSTIISILGFLLQTAA